MIKDSGARAPLPPFSDEHDQLRETINRWVREEIVPHVDDWEAAREFPRELYTRAAELGFLGLKYPTELGGQGGDYVHDAVWAEELAAAGASGGVGAGPRRPHRDRDSAGVQVRHAPTSTSASCARRSAASRSRRSASPSPVRARTSPRSERRPAESTAAGSSTARRPSSPTACAPTSSSAR